ESSRKTRPGARIMSTVAAPSLVPAEQLDLLRPHFQPLAECQPDLPERVLRYAVEGEPDDVLGELAARPETPFLLGLSGAALAPPWVRWAKPTRRGGVPGKEAGAPAGPGGLWGAVGAGRDPRGRAAPTGPGLPCGPGARAAGRSGSRRLAAEPAGRGRGPAAP